MIPHVLAVLALVSMTLHLDACANDPMPSRFVFRTVPAAPMSLPTPLAYLPPLFLAQAADEPLLPLNHFDIVQSWRQAGQRAEVHVCERGATRSEPLPSP